MLATHRSSLVGSTALAGKVMVRSLPVACLAFTGLLGGQALAAAQDPAQPGDIVVTASRRDQKLEKVPYAISAVGGTTLAARGIVDTSQLSHEVAGMNYVEKGPFAGLSNSTITIHGLNAQNSFSFTPNQTSPTVATYINDTPVFVNLVLKDLDRVEVLKGPQGTLYGASSLGGTVRYIQHKPELGKFDANMTSGVEGTASSSEPSYNFDGMINIPIGQNFAIRANASYERIAGFINQPNIMLQTASGAPVLADPSDVINSPGVFTSKKNTNQYETKTARVSALWKPTPTLSLRVDYNYQHATADGRPTISPGIYGDKLENVTLHQETLTDKVNVVSGTTALDLGFATLTETSSYYDHHAEGLADPTNAYKQFSFYTAYYGSNPRAIIDSHDLLTDKGNVHELRLASKGGSRFDWVGGVYYADEHLSPSSFQYYPGYVDYFAACQPVYGYGSSQCGVGTFYGTADTLKGIPVQKDLAYLSNLHVRFKDLAAYGELTWHVTDALQVTGGLRAFKQTISATQQVGLLFDGPDFVSNESRSFKSKKVLFKANASYQISDDMLAFATFAQGFRRGMVNALPTSTPAGGPVDPAVFSSQPDIANNYEAGIKGKHQGFTYALSGYYIDWKKIQANLYLTDLSIGGVVNVGNGYSSGLDLETTWSSRRVYLQLNYSFNKSKFKSINPAILTEAYVTPVPGGSFPGVSKHTGSARAEYIVIPDGDVRLRVGASGSYQSSQPTTISADSVRVKGFAMVGLYTTATYGRWSARLYVDNVFNVLGITSIEDPKVYASAYSASVSRPRTVGLSVSVHL